MSQASCQSTPTPPVTGISEAVSAVRQFPNILSTDKPIPSYSSYHQSHSFHLLFSLCCSARSSSSPSQYHAIFTATYFLKTVIQNYQV